MRIGVGARPLADYAAAAGLPASSLPADQGLATGTEGSR